MHYYSFNIKDYRKDTQHLQPMEHYIYRMLIDLYYMDEKPIPKKTQWVMRRLMLVSEEHKIMLENVLEDFFYECDDGFRHKRIESEIKQYHANAEKNRKNGAKGGRPRKDKPKNNPVGFDSVTDGLPLESQNNPNQEPLTNNQEPLTSFFKKENEAESNFTSSSEFSINQSGYITTQDVEVSEQVQKARSKKADEILNWQQPNIATMSKILLAKAGRKMNLTGSEYGMAVDGFKNHYADRADIGKGLTPRMIPTSFLDWIIDKVDRKEQKQNQGNNHANHQQPNSQSQSNHFDSLRAEAAAKYGNAQSDENSLRTVNQYDY